MNLENKKYKTSITENIFESEKYVSETFVLDFFFLIL